MDAHLEMGEANITYEDMKAAADKNGRSVAQTLDILERTVAKDRGEHPGVLVRLMVFCAAAGQSAQHQVVDAGVLAMSNDDGSTATTSSAL
jgi:hypothetical protein